MNTSRLSNPAMPMAEWLADQPADQLVNQPADQPEQVIANTLGAVSSVPVLPTNLIAPSGVAVSLSVESLPKFLSKSLPESAPSPEALRRSPFNTSLGSSLTPSLSSPLRSALKLRRKQAWLAVHLPQWPLQAWVRAVPETQRTSMACQPVAILDTTSRVLCVNAVAATHGVRVGQSMQAALSLCAALQLMQRDAVREQAALQWLANWAMQFTPLVHVATHNELLLEVRGSLRLFGGPAALLETLQHALLAQQLQAVLVLCPTARAATWLVRQQAELLMQSGKQRSNALIVTTKQMRSALSGIALQHLHWPEALQIKLQRFGLRQVGELWRLPRTELLRRIGVSAMRELDAAVGRELEQRQPFKPPQRYCQQQLLDHEINTVAQLEQLMSVLLVSLQQWLRQHDLALTSLRWLLKHRDATTPLVIAIAQPTMELPHLQLVLHERLKSLVLSAPVLAIQLQVKQLFAAAGRTQDAWRMETDTTPSNTPQLHEALDRIRARLGMQSVQVLHSVADHRPEAAQVWQVLSPQAVAIPTRATGSATAVATGADTRAHARADTAAEVVVQALPERPAWLLETPECLGTAVKPPVAFQLLQGPERIEVGWWDERPIQRDYYQALYGARRCWIYRDRQQARWYLHGWFG